MWVCVKELTPYQQVMGWRNREGFQGIYAMSDRIRIGLVGLKFGVFHLRTLLQEPQFSVVGLADRHPESPSATQARALAPEATYYTNGEELIAAGGLDALCLSTSPAHRAPLLKAAVATGIPVFVEKPWAADPDSGEELVQFIREHNGRVMLGFSFRFHPAITRLRQLLDSDLGAPWMLNGEYAFEHPVPPGSWLWDPLAGGGFFNENSCHLVDAVCHLMGPPVAVSATTANPRSAPGPELAALTLSFAEGGIAALTLGAAAAPGLEDFPRIDLVTAAGQARLRGRHHIWESLTWALRKGGESQNFHTPAERLGTTRYTHAWRHFADCLRQGNAFAATPEEGQRAVRVIHALQEAARQNTTISLHPPINQQEP